MLAEYSEGNLGGARNDAAAGRTDPVNACNFYAQRRSFVDHDSLNRVADPLKTLLQAVLEYFNLEVEM
jgi:hypothetical protein